MTTIEEVYQSFIDRQYAYRDDYDREYKRQIATEYSDDPVTFHKMYPMDNDPYAKDVVTRYLDQEDLDDESYDEPNDPFAVLSFVLTILFLLWLFVLRHIPYRAIYNKIAGLCFTVYLFIVDPPVPRPLPAFRGDLR
ncbi:hypothetical protein N3K66_004171 [Trichothecium roseum]|uniref:Uncharacterized protein n=1 Tax=Trichothecium roseum TaxID=47278 RepID=A0ACC0V0H8_9HYPO|nr:hypothetical protein N3K66_004171 [Trichothecium roseum]